MTPGQKKKKDREEGSSMLKKNLGSMTRLKGKVFP